MSPRAWVYGLLFASLLWLLIAGAGRALWLLLGGWWFLLAPFLVVLGVAALVVALARLITAWSHRRPAAPRRPLISEDTQRRRDDLHADAWRPR